ncbi:MAG: DUF6786 family protein [Chitinophagaceae bacterium]
MKNKIGIIALIILLLNIECKEEKKKPLSNERGASTPAYAKGSFGYDLEFLKKYHNDLILLGDDTGGAQLILLPAYQGRVMTSTADGNNGNSFGWVNHAFIESNKHADHINVYGGEERFWLGPEGGQFALYFKKGVPFTFENWFVPKELDTDSFLLVSATKREANFKKEMHLENYSGNRFDLLVNRTIRLLDRRAINEALNTELPSDLQVVAFESINKITNIGKSAWNKKSGMLSIWILSMLNASDKTTVALPYKQGDSTRLGKIVTDDYFGKVPIERLAVNNGLILFKADANHRSKIGIAPSRALPIVASYDASTGVLTIAQFSLPVGAKDYVNSLWKLQDKPFSGDAINAYNDGPMNGAQLGKFYEIESSSPAAALLPAQSIEHLHRTMHLKGSKKSLDLIANQLLGIGVDKIKL